ncbi:MAG: phospholipase [Chloroflexaceae bacterium]|nr:phospholipase [Chloroflexaceae bacterium]
MSETQRGKDHIHEGQPVLAAGMPLEQSRVAVVMLHGRGASADSILSLHRELDVSRVTYLAPQAHSSSWYPQRFLAPTASNEPWITSALNVISQVLRHLETVGIDAERTILMGFSQGACLALEYAARYGRRYGGIAGLSGGLIGADDEPRQDSGHLEGTPVFLGCSDVDFHIPMQRVEHAGRVLQERGAQVTIQFYPRMGHTINHDEIDAVRAMIAALIHA